jgi:hypothetical protein
MHGQSGGYYYEVTLHEAQLYQIGFCAPGCLVNP